MLLYEEVEKTFLQIRIREPENALRFDWAKNQDPKVIEIC